MSVESSESLIFHAMLRLRNSAASGNCRTIGLLTSLHDTSFNCNVVSWAAHSRIPYPPRRVNIQQIRLIFIWNAILIRKRIQIVSDFFDFQLFALRSGSFGCSEPAMIYASDLVKSTTK